MQRIRWPKNFSVFSGSDSDSDGQPAQRRARPSNMHIDIPAGSSSYVNQSTTGAPQPIQGVYLFCAGDQVDLSTLQTPLVPTPIPNNMPAMGLATVSPSDQIFSKTASAPLPISTLIGIPLLMRRLQSKPSPTSPHFENTLASHLTFNEAAAATTADSGARGLGTVLVVRLDREPLQKELLERICAFHAKLLSLIQQRGPGSTPDVLKSFATPEQFLSFCMESSSNRGNVASSVHDVLGGSWLDIQRPMAAA
ncbi:hypothetical protein M408DRAFT_6218 [Serendipita vermifera MAFF 305830]|uniref:Uncharacterized protein n=1 Tax=Serendipita vermifera MAFF 305830 TaxID=933852 RepID=A0A0C3B7E9_SERVB|nr:hypothetical protein M408DRAFT_6218 [Serendipita vermifera MAFF 305830]